MNLWVSKKHQSWLARKGYESIRITRQFLGLTAEENRHTNAMRFIHDDGRLIYRQQPAYNPDSFYFGKTIKLGKGTSIAMIALSMNRLTLPT